MLTAPHIGYAWISEFYCTAQLNTNRKEKSSDFFIHDFNCAIKAPAMCGYKAVKRLRKDENFNTD